MTTKGSYSFKPVGAIDPDTPVVTEAVPLGEGGAEETPSVTAIMVGMGIVGWMIGGPFIAVITALGGKYAADKKGIIGESVISVGRIAATAGKKAEEEHLLEKLKDAIHSLFSKSISNGKK